MHANRIRIDGSIPCFGRLLYMEHFLDKLSRYHILNNLIPGITFLYIIDVIGIYTIDFDNTYGVFFIGYRTMV